ncbi:hypothetical protein TWF569_010977 [Orbilia oligospora]|uniref:GST C-terminal domain-containing protein n=1 Tax=Orbilia oligospora TaxID=2813651 RepID=A0A7C8JGF5_ORBOL|nr:hypothetical protein TWF103_003053 [Orbilia oligospora]KAF3101979.1 hypothetical protein TWF102_004713 [Orbilia oligospora]KAF3121203.1 hypothetical protein TWF594_003402 [Orbilia oligospora]KAF3132103.1 hypothetical protein TWF569_010977 [Orbilia oligospora]
MAPTLPIVLYHYVFSPVGRRIIWYMTLRNIPYTHCLQPLALPRPDIAQIGVSYRRIPVLAIGRDVYLDSRLIMRKLEELYPPSTAHPSLSGTTGDQKAIERLLDVLMSDSGIFDKAIQLLPLDFPPLSDPEFLKDRAELAGIVPGKTPPPQSVPGPDPKLRRPIAAAELRDAMEILETTLLADGRDWVLKTDRPMLADIEAVWLFEWMVSMNCFSPELINSNQFPKILAWIDRLSKLVAEKVKESPAEEVNGDVAAATIFNSGYAEEEGIVEGKEAVVAVQGLKKGDLVNVYPTDNGSLHKDTGALVSLNSKEVVINLEGKNGKIRVHAPRHKFAIEAV